MTVDRNDGISSGSCKLVKDFRDSIHMFMASVIPKFSLTYVHAWSFYCLRYENFQTEALYVSLLRSVITYATWLANNLACSDRHLHDRPAAVFIQMDEKGQTIQLASPSARLLALLRFS